MKINIGTIEFSDDLRRAIWWHENAEPYEGNPAKCPKADRKQTKNYFIDHGMAYDDDILYDWQACIESFEKGGDDDQD